MTIREFREKVNLRLYESKKQAIRILRILTIIVSFTAFSALIAYYGFPQNEESKLTLLRIFKSSFVFYILNYIIRFVYDFEPRTYFKRTWFEGTLMLFLIIEGISFNLFGTLLISRFLENWGVVNISDYSNLFIQFYFLMVILYEAGKSSSILPIFKIHPANIFIASFLLIIFGGTFMIMLPEMTVAEGSMNFLDALFMSTSATCVTGLATVSVALDFTFKGQVILMILMKLGGLNIIAFGSFIALASKFGFGVKQHAVLEDFVNRDSVLSASGMLRKIILWSIAIEVIGAILLFFFWDTTTPFENVRQKIFFSFFHSFSAFNNAGLSLFPDGFYDPEVRHNYAVHNIITLLVFFGALGFVAIFDLFSISKIKERLKVRWKEYQFSTKIALYFSLGLVVFGWFFFYIHEIDNTLRTEGFWASMSHSLFQSVTRTSGFNTVDIGALSLPSLLMLIFLMFVGSSSSSTGGGIKTSTFAIVWATLIGTIKGRDRAQLFKKTIPMILIFRAFSVFLIFLIGDLLGVYLLSLTETEILATKGYGILDLIFEEVSAFGTVGLSTGITPLLSDPGKIIIILSMFVGRVGTLTVAFALGKEDISKRYKYPDGHTMVG